MSDYDGNHGMKGEFCSLKAVCCFKYGCISALSNC